METYVVDIILIYVVILIDHLDSRIYSFTSKLDKIYKSIMIHTYQTTPNQYLHGYLVVQYSSLIPCVIFRLFHLII